MVWVFQGFVSNGEGRLRAGRNQRPRATPHCPAPRPAAGIQVCLSIACGWLAAKARVVDPVALNTQLNRLAMVVCFPCFIVHLLGIRTDLQDTEAWKWVAAGGPSGGCSARVRLATAAGAGGRLMGCCLQPGAAYQPSDAS
jgi:hypothetical protein